MSLLALAALGCGARSTRIGDDDVYLDSDTDVDTDTDTDTCADPHSADVHWDRHGDDVDLLVMVDNSSSMREEQANLTANLPPIIDVLTNPRDENGDGAPDHPPVSSLHIGVISSDMGTAGYPVTTCDNAERGDDGILQNLPSPAVEGCDASYPRFLTFDVEAPDENIARDFECIATLGTGGCGMEQQLYAIEKALTVHSALGAANCARESECFLRDDALLAVLVVTDEEDCSVEDPRIFEDDEELGPTNVRCFLHPEMVRPVDEFVSSILSVKPGRPNRIVVAGIIGVPTDLVWLSEDDLRSDDIQTTHDFEEILSDPRMVETVDYSREGGGMRLVASCDVPGLGIAFPPRRIVEFVREVDRVGNNGIVQSICQADWVPTMRAVTRLIQSNVRGACLGRPLVNPNGSPLRTREHVDCVVRETLPDNGRCGQGRFRVGREDGTGNTICQVCQLGDGEEPHTHDAFGNSVADCAGEREWWFYTTQDERCGNRGKIEFTDQGTPRGGSSVRLTCTEETLPVPPECEE